MFLTREPAGPLAACVDVLWACSRPGLVGEERVVPFGGTQLLVNLASDRLSWRDEAGAHAVSGAAIGGLFTGPIHIDVAEQAAAVGASFSPAGLASFLGSSVEAVSGGFVDLQGLWDDDDTARTLHDMRRGDLASALVRLEGLLLRRLRRRPPRSLTAAVAALRLPRARVDRVADGLGWTGRSLARRFRRDVGLRPKQFARIARFRAALEQLGPDTDRGALAFGMGYADQAHFNHDFRDLSGLSPGAWLDGSRPFTTHRVEFSTSGGERDG